MNILVAGGCGYKGSVLIPKLLKEGHQVTNIDTEWFGNYLKPDKNLNSIKQDIRNIKDVAPYLTFDQGLAFPTSFSSSLDYLVDSLSVDFDNGTSTFTGSALPTADMGTLPTA